MNEDATKKVLRKFGLIQKLEKEGLAKYPTFTAYVDGGDSIELGETTVISFERLQSILKFCQKNNLRVQIVSSENDKTIRSGWMQISLYEND